MGRIEQQFADLRNHRIAIGVQGGGCEDGVAERW